MNQPQNPTPVIPGGPPPRGPGFWPDFPLLPPQPPYLTPINRHPGLHIPHVPGNEGWDTAPGWYA